MTAGAIAADLPSRSSDDSSGDASAASEQPGQSWEASIAEAGPSAPLSYDDPVAGAVTAASLAEEADEESAEPQQSRADARREAKRLKAEKKQAQRRERSEARAMAKARRERHTIEARIEREKAAAQRDEESRVAADRALEAPVREDGVVEEDVLEEHIIVDEPVVVEEPGEPEASDVTPDAADVGTEETPEAKPAIDQDTAVALAVASARPEAVSRVVDPIRVAADALDLEDAEAAKAAEDPAPEASVRPRDAVSASLSDRAAAQLAKRRRREEERAAREAGTTEQTAVQEPIAAFDVPEPRAPRSDDDTNGSRLWSTVVSVIGIAGYVCAVLLAIGAMAVALGLADGDLLFDLFSPLCDILVAPARGLVSFSGENAETKELFLAYSVGSVVYLIIGLVAQNLPRTRQS